MPKRKRTQSMDLEEVQPNQKNPFLVLMLSEKDPTFQVDDQQQLVLDHTLAFSDYISKRQTIDDDDNLADGKTSLTYLLSYLEPTKTEQPDQTLAAISTNEIALLILPWAVKKILSPTFVSWKETNLLVWRAVAVTLHHLTRAIDRSVHYAVSQQVLTQSTLFQLCPRVALLALSKDDSETESKARVLAARVFRLLVQDLFRPTLDVAAKSLLIPLAQHLIAHEATETTRFQEEILSTTDVVVATLRLLHLLLLSGRGNPRTTFLLFAQKKVLLALASFYGFLEGTCNEHGKELIMKSLSDALFHPRHHMEGFFSLLHKAPLPWFDGDVLSVAEGAKKDEGKASDKERKFRSYQQELITSVDDILGEERGMEQEMETQVPAIHLVPVLLESFFQQSRAYDIHRGQDNKKRKSSREDELSRIQFHLFAAWTVPLQSFVLSASTNARHASTISISSEPFVIKAALKSMRRMIELVLEHDVYTPSQDDSQNRMFGFLAAVTRQVVSLSVNDPELQASLFGDAIPILALLFRLNHLLVHDKASETLLFCLHDGSRGLTTLVGALFVSFFHAYRKLRQQSFAISTVLSVLDELCAQKETDQISRLASLLKVESVASSIAVSVQECPIDQAKDIFDLLDAWIQGKVSLKTTAAHSALDVFSELVLLTTRNIRVERATATLVADIARKFMDGTVLFLEELLSKQPERDLECKLIDVAMRICAWVLQLHGRCSFWLGRSARLEIPDGIVAILEASLVARPAEGNASHPALADGVILLGCHRLRQLHSLIHEQESLVRGGKDDKGISLTLLADARRLSSGISLAANASKNGASQGSNDGSHWSIVAENFVFWAEYAEDTHFLDFLTWICRSLSSLNASGCLRRDVEIAKALISDTSFLEDARVRAHLFRCTLLLSIDMIVEPIRQEDHRCTREILKALQTPKTSDALVDLLEPLGNKAFCWKGLSMEVSEELGLCSKKVAHLISIVSGLPLSNHPSVIPENIHLCCNLDFAFRCMASLDPITAWGDILSAMNCLREYLSRVVESSLEVSAGVNAKRDVQLLGNMLNASVDFVAGSMRCDHVQPFCSLTGELLERLAGVLSSDAVVASLDGLCQSWARVLDTKTTDTDQLNVLASFGSAITGIIQSNYQAFMTRKDSLQRLIDHLWKILRFSTNSGLSDKCDALYMASDLLQLQYKPSNATTLEDRLEVFCFEILESNIGQNETLVSSCSSVLGSIAMAANRAAHDRLLNIVIRNEQENPVLEATFCHSVRLLSAVKLARLLEKLVSGADESPKRMRFVLLLLQSLTDGPQIEVLSTFSRRIFNSVLLGFSHRQISTDDKSLDKMLIVLDEIVQRREFLVLRESDLAMVLSSVAGMLAKRDPTTEELTSSSFVLCCTLLTSMHQRYSKVMYACVPSVVTLHARLMESVMLGPDDGSDDRCTRSFTRICEVLVPHKDVYKKHVLGLVLQFVVRGLPTMPLARRAALIPAIYFLLDVLSTYETQQLNACMDTQHRVEFRRIYQYYQRFHSYKGQ